MPKKEEPKVIGGSSDRGRRYSHSQNIRGHSNRVAPVQDLIVKDAVISASCKHLDQFILAHGYEPFAIIHGVFSSSVSEDARRQKVSNLLDANKGQIDRRRKCHSTLLFSFYYAVSGNIVSVLQMWKFWAATIFLLTLHIFWMQRRTHIKSFGLSPPQYRA